MYNLHGARRQNRKMKKKHYAIYVFRSVISNLDPNLDFVIYS